MKTLGAATVVIAGLLAGAAHAAAIQSGPMVGYSTMREVAVWIQTDGPAEVALRVTPSSGGESRTYSPIATDGSRAHTVHLVADGLQPGTRYDYRISLDGKALEPVHRQQFVTQPLWHWRHDPPDFRFAVGSCFFVNETVYDRPGRPYGGRYEILDQILARQPSFMLWMGDTVYLREADWNSRSGIYYRYTHTRSLPELQPLLASVHHYAVWDDHDFGPDNSNRSFPMRSVTLSAFRDFWANPNYDATGQGGITGSFEWHDVQFFLLDNRWFRSANERVTGTRQIFGPAQVQWLIDALKASKASFKFVVTSGVFINDVRAGEWHLFLAPEERERVIQLITREQIPGVVFLNGDIHRSQLAVLERADSYPLYEWTVSPLTAGTFRPATTAPNNRIESSVLTERNFGLIDVTGPAGDRSLRLRLVDWRGEQRWERTIRQAELGY